MTHPRGRLTLTVFLLIVSVSVLNALAELALKYGAIAAGIRTISPANFAAFAIGVLSSGGLWIGIGCYLVMFLLWITVLSHVELSVAFPLHSIDYLLVPLMSMVVLHERIMPLRWIGAIFVMIGVCLISWSTTHSEHPKA